MGTDLRWHTGIPRLDDIFKEIKAAKLSLQCNGVAVLFRSYLDMVVYQYLQKTEGLKELIRAEQQKLDQEKGAAFSRMKKYLTELGIPEEAINEKDMLKIMKLKTSISPDWVPSLKHMLAFLSSNATLLPDNKQRSALGSYVNKNNTYLDHSDFNLLVHNEYFIKDGKDIKKAFNQMQPILQHIIQQLSGT